MINLIAVLHIIFAIVLIVLVLVQDSKGGGALGIGGGSNSVLGATGAQTLASKATRYVAALLALTCLYLTYHAGQARRSVLDSTPAQAQVPPMTPAPTPTTPDQGTNAGVPNSPPINNGPAQPGTAGGGGTTATSSSTTTTIR